MLAFHTWRSSRQIVRADGFLGGYLASGPGMALWTVTVWVDGAATRAYRNSAEHLRAMPVLIGSCDEAAVAHWFAEDVALPSPAAAAAALKEGGRTSKLRHPSPGHAAGDTVPDDKAPARGPSLRARRASLRP